MRKTSSASESGDSIGIVAAFLFLALLAAALVVAIRYAPMDGMRADLTGLGRGLFHRSLPRAPGPDPHRQVTPHGQAPIGVPAGSGRPK